MRREGLDLAIRAAGGIGALARGLGISQPAVSNWRRVPAERVLAVEAFTGVSCSALRPDLYPDPGAMTAGAAYIDDIDLLRAAEYGLFATLLRRAPDQFTLQRVAALEGDETPLGRAHIALAEAAAASSPETLQGEFFNLFIGLGRGDLLPYSSYYLTGFLQERPLGRVRSDLAALGIEPAEDLREPEDHIAILCEVMAGLAAGRFEAGPGADRRFFDLHLKSWAARFFADLEAAPSARFYKLVGVLGRLFMMVEAEAFAMDQRPDPSARDPATHRTGLPGRTRSTLAQGRGT